jgi:hypothetical protein
MNELSRREVSTIGKEYNLPDGNTKLIDGAEFVNSYAAKICEVNGELYQLKVVGPFWHREA